jgi:transient receptor potential cation channel subfamily A member 1
MLGELDYDHTYIENADNQHFSNINLLILLLFAVIMPILLMNLLVGLAIGDLMQIQQNARLKRLAMQVSCHRRNYRQQHIEPFRYKYIRILRKNSHRN